MRLFLDEQLSPVLASRLNATGRHDASHPRDYGRLGEPDHLVLRRCVDESRVIVTQNARDFRKLVGAVELHPGLIILPAAGREASWDLLERAVRWIEALGEPGAVMINRVVEVSAAGEIAMYALPVG